MWATGQRLINSIAAARLVSSASDAVLKIAIGTIAATGATLLGAYLLGLTATFAFFLVLLMVLNNLPRLRWVLFYKRLEHAFLRHRKFFQLGLLESLFTTVGMQAPVLLFAGIFGTAEAALLFLALQIMRAPITLISNAVGRVYLSELTNAQKNQIVIELTREHLGIIAKTGIPLLILLGLTGSAFAGWIFGPDYSDLTYYMLYMLPWMTMVMLTAPFTTVLYSYERFQLALYLAILGACLRIGSVFFSYALDLDPVLTLAIASIATYLLYIISISHIIGIGLRGWFNPLLDAAPRILVVSTVGILIILAGGRIL